MVNEKFETIILNDKHLNALLNEKSINVFSEFPKKEDYSEAFKEYIKPKYIEVFREIFSDTNDSNTGKRSALLRSLDALSTPDFKQEVIDEIVSTLNKSYLKFTEFKKIIGSYQHSELESKLEIRKDGESDFDSIFDNFNLSVYNVLDKETKVKELKTKIIDDVLSVCDATSTANPKKETVKYAIYNVMMNNLERIKFLTEEQQQRFETHKSKITNKRNVIDAKYYLYTAIVVILIVFKFVYRMSR